MRTTEEQNAYDEGYHAYQDEQNGIADGYLAVEMNPYTAVTDDALWDAWDEGYSAAGWDD